MEFTVYDAMKLKRFSSMRLIAGEDGLSRTISNCGILDYEFDQHLKDRYLHVNFRKGQFILTTFLYARDNEYLIGDAIKHLINKEVSALAIKNIYHLPIHEPIIRYANSKKFPIFKIEDTKLYFEDIILDVATSVQRLKQDDFGTKTIDLIVHSHLDKESLTGQVMQLHPSLSGHFVAVYLKYKKALAPDLHLLILNQFQNSSLCEPSHALYCYRNGLMLICSFETFEKKVFEEFYADFFHLINGNLSDFHIGISDYHHKLYELKEALSESIYASALHEKSEKQYVMFSDIGSYQVLFPSSQNESFQRFSNKILEPIIQFDAENKGHLLETLTEFIHCHGDIKRISTALSQHENTVRYRLEKIRAITGLNYRNPDDYEQLSIAVKVFICNDLTD